MLQRLKRAESERALEEWLLDYYVAGWADADPVRILEATAPNYHFYDPLVGLFSRQSLSHYFEMLRAKCARAGALERSDFAFVLRGPMDGPVGRQQFWREAPQIGLTGTAQIMVGPYGVMSEEVAYDLNLASDLLRRR